MFDLFHYGFPIMFFLAFGLVFFTFIHIITSHITEWRSNQASDIRMRNVRVIAKRPHVHGHNHAHTTYYATFEFLDDGSRLELKVPAKAFGLMAEGDLGILNYQGTQFNAFELTKNQEVYR